jgi:hypothetical protein
MIDQKYILDGRQPKAVDLMTWARWFETADRHVADEIVNGYRVSTVFLGIDHGFPGDGPPLLFETMVFPNSGASLEEQFCERAATWDEAEACHQRGIEFVRTLTLN